MRWYLISRAPKPPHRKQNLQYQHFSIELGRDDMVYAT